MKICGACVQELAKDKFSKKQWQLKQERRCKDCIADNREIQPRPPINSSATIPRQNATPIVKTLTFPGPENEEQNNIRVLDYKHISDSSDDPMAITRKPHGKWHIQIFSNDMVPHPTRWVEFRQKEGGVLELNFDPDYDRNSIHFPVFDQMKSTLTEPQPDWIETLNQRYAQSKMDDATKEDAQKNDTLLDMTIALAQELLETTEFGADGRGGDGTLNSICTSLKEMYADNTGWNEMTGLFTLLLDRAIKNKSSLTRTTLFETMLGVALEGCGLFSRAAVIYAEAGRHLHAAHHRKSSSVNYSAGLAWEKHGDYEMAEGNYTVALQSLPFEYDHVKYREGAFKILASLIKIYENKDKKFAPPNFAAILRPLLLGAGAEVPHHPTSSENVLIPEYRNAKRAKLRGAIQYIIMNSTSVQTMREAIDRFSCSDGATEDAGLKCLSSRTAVNDIFDDEDLFMQPPTNEDCLICFLPMLAPKHQMCCGKDICSGCLCAIVESARAHNKPSSCPFCRTPAPSSDKEALQMCMKRVEMNDADAFYYLGCGYRAGNYGLLKSESRGNEQWKKGAQLGSNECRVGLGLKCMFKDDDTEKAHHYLGLAAIEGSASARYYLGELELKNKNFKRALMHFMIGAKAGHDESLERIREGFMATSGMTKDDYATALRAHQKAKDAMRSAQRKKATVNKMF